MAHELRTKQGKTCHPCVLVPYAIGSPTLKSVIRVPNSRTGLVCFGVIANLFSIVVFTPEASFHATRLALSHAKRLLTSSVCFRLACSSLVLL
jgi:hypothetical protein